MRLRYRRSHGAEAQAAAVVAALQAAVPVFSTDGRTVDDLVADGLRSAGATLAVAESCTGGLLGARLTQRARLAPTTSSAASSATPTR